MQKILYTVLALIALLPRCASNSVAEDAARVLVAADTLPGSKVYHRKNISKTEEARLQNILSEPLKDTSLYIDPLPGAPDLGFILFSKYSGAFDGMMNFVLIADNSIDSVVYEANERRVTIHASRKDSSQADFFKLQNGMSGYFYYYRYHDIYQSLFRYPAVKKVTVIADGRDETYFPSNGEQPPAPPNGTMKTEWYIRNINYWAVFDEDNSTQFLKDQEHVYVLKNESVATTYIEAYRKAHPGK